MKNKPNNNITYKPVPYGGGEDGAVEAKVDMVNHPPHYKHPSGLECIRFTRDAYYNVGNAFKYIFRAGNKGNKLEDYKKALFYLNDEKERRNPYFERLADSIKSKDFNFIFDLGKLVGVEEQIDPKKANLLELVGKCLLTELYPLYAKTSISKLEEIIKNMENEK